MTTIDIISGFLGAGKTTLIKKLISEAFQGQKLVLIENEFGEIGIDGGFLKDAGIQITEMNSGCICCSLVGDFGQALRQVLEQYHPDRILIEPSGVGKLSDVSKAVGRVAEETDMKLGSAVTVVNAKKCKMYMKNFGEFFNDQVEHAGTVILSRTQDMSEAKLQEVIDLIRTKNPRATIVTTPWDDLTGGQILSAIAGGDSLADELMALLHAQDDGHDEHHHHHYDENGVCSCGHHHDDDEDEEHEHHHHHHDHDEEGHEHHHHHDHDEDEEHEHHHHHDHDEEGHEHHHHDHDECGCGHHHHHHHHGHDADEVFTSWGMESPRKFTEAEIKTALEALDTGAYGAVLRSKGIVPCVDGTWLHFDMVPGEIEIRRGSADYTGRLCVIGSQLKEEQVQALFNL
ncbi:MAG: GTP-binding protein [Clostridiales bacterium]|nr:GTP-binding protein [Clostridiales bacterium]